MTQMTLKYSLYIIETLSICTLLIIYISLIYSMINYYRKDLLYNKLSFDYNTSKNSNGSLKIDVIKIYNESNEFNGLGILIINKKFYNDNQKNFYNNNFIAELIKNKYCFVFDQSYINKGISFLGNFKKFSEDLTYISLFTIFFIFCVFLKMHLFKKNLEYINTYEFLKENSNKKTLITPMFNKIYFFNYVIFYLSMIISFPMINNIYSRFYFEDCLSFYEFSYESFIYERKFSNYNNPNISVSKIEDFNLDNFFFYQKNDIFDTLFKESNWINILFMSSFIWTSNYFDLFSIEFKSSLEKVKYKKLKLYEWIIFSFSITINLTFFLSGLLYNLDNITLFFKFCNYNIEVIGSNYVVNIVFIISHVILYSIIIFYSVKNMLKSLFHFNKNRIKTVIDSKCKTLKIFKNKKKLSLINPNTHNSFQSFNSNFNIDNMFISKKLRIGKSISYIHQDNNLAKKVLDERSINN